MSYRKIKPINEEQYPKSKRCKKNVDRMYRIESERSKNLRKKQSQIKKNNKTNTKEKQIDDNTQIKGLLYTHGDKSYFGIPVETKWFFGTRLTKSSKRKITDFIRMNAKFFHSEYEQGYIYEFIHKLFKYKNYLYERKDFIFNQKTNRIKYGFIHDVHSTNKNKYLFIVSLTNIDTRNFTISLKSTDFKYVAIEDFIMNIYNEILIESTYKMPNHAKIHVKDSANLSDKVYFYYKTMQNIPDGVKRDTFNFAYTKIDMK